MIRTDQELESTQTRISTFYAQVFALRQKEKNPQNYALSAGGFLTEIAKMQREVNEYLMLPSQH